jgi:hypothetical protein
MECEVVEVCWTASAIHLTGLSDIAVIFMSLNTLLQLLSWSSGADEVWGRNFAISLPNFNLEDVIRNHNKDFSWKQCPKFTRFQGNAFKSPHFYT